MSVSMNLHFNVSVRRTGVLAPQFVTRIDELVTTGKIDLRDVPTPPTWGELPMLSVADLLEEQANQEKADFVEDDVRLALPSYWRQTDVVIPVFPGDCGSLKLAVDVPDYMGTIAALKGVDIRTGKPVEDHPMYAGRQNFFIGPFEIGGTVTETSDSVIQWMIVPPSAAKFDTSRQVGVANIMEADGFHLAFFAHREVQKYLNIGSGSRYYDGAESLRSLSPMAAAMPAAKGLALESLSIDEVYIAPGATMSGSYPDDPSIKEGDLQNDPWMNFWIRLVPVSVFNRFAGALNAPKVEQKAITAARKQQEEFDRTVGKFLTVGLDTGTGVTKRLQRVPDSLSLDDATLE